MTRRTPQLARLQFLLWVIENGNLALEPITNEGGLGYRSLVALVREADQEFRRLTGLDPSSVSWVELNTAHPAQRVVEALATRAAEWTR